MSWPELFAAAVVQGLTEFLPVSSSGHIVLVHHFWDGTGSTLAVDVLLHVGTTLAVIVAYWHTITAWFRHRQRELCMIGVATLPTVIIALWLRQTAMAFTQNTWWVGVALLGTAVWVGMGNRLGRRHAQHSGVRHSMTWRTALLIGSAQGVSVLPGMSRSGATISTALTRGISPLMAVEFSLLLSLPAVLGAMVLEMRDPAIWQTMGISASQCGVGVLLTFVVGWCSIRLLQVATRRYALAPFAWYCGLLGAWLVVRGLT